MVPRALASSLLFVLNLPLCRIPRGPLQQPLEDRIFAPAVSAVYSTVSSASVKQNRFFLLLRSTGLILYMEKPTVLKVHLPL